MKPAATAALHWAAFDPIFRPSNGDLDPLSLPNVPALLVEQSDAPEQWTLKHSLIIAYKRALDKATS